MVSHPSRCASSSADTKPFRTEQCTPSRMASSSKQKGQEDASVPDPSDRIKPMTAEENRLEEDRSRTAYWKRWGPYLSARQWGTVREDYSEYGTSWEYFPHDHARSRAYRWGEDGILGISDNHQRLCFALTLWNGQDPILKERFFGLTGTEG